MCFKTGKKNEKKLIELVHVHLEVSGSCLAALAFLAHGHGADARHVLELGAGRGLLGLGAALLGYTGEVTCQRCGIRGKSRKSETKILLLVKWWLRLRCEGIWKRWDYAWMWQYLWILWLFVHILEVALVDGASKTLSLDFRCSRWPTWNPKFAMPCEKVYEKQGALMGAPKKDLRNFQCLPQLSLLHLASPKKGLETRPETQMMSLFWLGKDFVSQVSSKQGSRMFQVFTMFNFILNTIYTLLSTNGPQMLQIQEKQDSSLLVVPLPLTMRMHLQTAFITMSQWVSPPKIYPHLFLLPRHFSLKPGTSACRPNEVVAGPGSTVGCCHRCW